ncbi:deformed epidermal autoregulatory factor 1 homolog [Caerostris darwini]|uniref:Deformed epidermal autoregulatory factor 1 homolog n=1 Tax=Caerostris darwini TaxID=1538125 RepID=A0AAV4QFQ9_9ARAC|nr:deformed epidermal autoregulatory factor 1 homolog [Caerostris darwini]
MVDSMDLGLTDEDLPNGRSDEVVNAISGISEESDRQQLVTVSGIAMPPNVLVTTSSGSIFGDQEGLKATRIIIHNPSSLDVLKTAQQTITFNPLNRSLSVPEKNINWDPSVYDAILPVRCRNIRGELHKSKFGSGNRGRSILVEGSWYTPSEFETLCGRGNSKDWKRSIRYGGRTLMCLIDQGILRPHATTCTCGACCDDNVSNGDGTPDASGGPVRLFTPYRRRKRKNHPKLKVSTNVKVSTRDNIVSAPVELPSEEMTLSSINDSVSTVTVPLITRDSGTVICSDSVIVSPEIKTQAPKTLTTTVDINEQKQWWQLEEMVKNAVRHILELQKQVEIVKNQCAVTRELALQELRNQMENEKKEAINACRLEAQGTLSRALLEAKSEKEVAIQQAFEQARQELEEKIHSIVTDKTDTVKRCANCDREAFSECTGCHRVHYCCAFCQRKDWVTHKDNCGENILDSECGTLIDSSEDPIS